MKPIDLNQTQINIIAISAVRVLIRKGLIGKDELLSEVAQQGVPAEWAHAIFELVKDFPTSE